MTTIKIQKATKKRSKLRLAFDGPAGAGKTYTALAVATEIAAHVGGRVGLIDTERGSASLYADKFDFDVVELEDFAPDRYVEAIRALEEGGYPVIVIDSLSHAWDGRGGALDLKDRAAAKSGNDWTAWRNVTPMHTRMVDAMLQSRAHIVATMRSKMEYVQEKDERGKTIIRKVGMAPVQRAGMEFEFTIVGDLDQSHVLTISKTRCDALDGQVIARPGAQLAKTLMGWLDSGVEPAPTAVPPAPAARPALAEEAPPLSSSATPASAGTLAEAPTLTPPPAPETAAQAMTEPLAVELERQLSEAKSPEAARAIADVIALAQKQGKVTGAERNRLAKVYTQVMARLQKAA